MNKGALALLSAYGGDSSDEEVPLGRVSTKRCLAEDTTPKKRLQPRLPVPEIIIKREDDKMIDNPAKHNGRIRTFPHERGNWATYVYIPYEPTDLAMADIITIIINNLPGLSLEPINDFHISLTKTVILRHHWIDLFMQSVREKVATIKRFILLFNSLKVYCNEERTRTFVGLEIKSGYDTLTRLVEQLNKSLDEFRLPPFYKNPSFHMSLAWCCGDHEKEITAVLPGLCTMVDEILLNYPQSSSYNFVQHLECKCGNKLFTFNLC